MRRWACRAVLWVSLLAAGPAVAETARFALVVGNNRGVASDTPLRFAHKDAERVARLLVDLGGFPEENTVLLKGRRAADLRRALLSVNERVRRAVGAGQRALLVVFYSGHADARALHLAGTTLAIDEVRQLVAGSAATARVLLLDACRSGSATRIKGGRPAPAFAIKLVDHLSTEGLAIITSSAATEDSQESDRLQGSFFTHFLLSGLRGAADRNRDRRVTLAEAYAYAYGNTLRATSETLAGPQHPTYQYDIRGKGDLVVTRLDGAADHGTLGFGRGGHYLVFSGDLQGPVVAEVVTEGPSRIALPPGRYFVRRRQPDLLLEGPVTVVAGQGTALDERSMRRVAYAQLVRKGAGRRPLSLGPQLSYVLHGPVADGLGPISQVELGLPLAIRHLTLTPRLAYGWTSGENQQLSLSHHELALALAAVHVFDLGRLGLFAGLSVGWTVALQRFDTVGVAPDRTSHLLAMGAEGGLELHLWRGLYLQLRGAALTYLFRRDGTEPGADPETTAVVTYQAAAGVGWQLW